MHPVDFLFEDIYRNYWGISPATEKPEARRLRRPALREREFLARRERRGG